ncbi:MAG: BrnT family toxin [Spirochaetes bacterium]|nr:BrnT family toxin [Spirochaetota bacterium]
MEFEWDEIKNSKNLEKHDVSFFEDQAAFYDPVRVIAVDIKHSTKNEKRYFCFGNVDDVIMTVRFTVRSDKIRIIGAGYWREGRKKYEEKNNV